MLVESASEQFESSSEMFDLGNLAPPPKQQKQVIKPFKPINTILKKGMDREINARVRKQRRQRRQRRQINDQVKEQDERSRSRQKYREGRRNGEGGKDNLAEGTTFASLNGGSSKSNRFEDKDVIEILSSDEENKVQNQFQALQRSIYGSFELRPTDTMNWRERRKLDRIMERGLRYYIEGKPRDQLSFQVFNTIEEYFR